MTFRCPTCGTRLEIADVLALTPRQRAIRDAIDTLRRQNGRGTVSTLRIAAEVGWSVRTVRNELSRLEQFRVVCRPAGAKSGWTLHKDTLALIRAA